MIGLSIQLMIDYKLIIIGSCETHLSGELLYKQVVCHW